MKPNTSNNGEHKLKGCGFINNRGICGKKGYLCYLCKNKLKPKSKKLSKGELYEIYFNSGINEGIKQGYAKARDDVEKIIKEYPLYDDVLIRTSEIKRGLKQEIAKLAKEKK